MSHFSLVAQGVDVSGVLRELDAQPNLWGQNAARTDDGSPHEGVPDIWLRWRAKEELTSPAAYDEMHYPVFWPAWYSLPSLHPIVRNLAPAIGATALGGILITRIPPGGEVKPHIDGGWHATFFNFKAYICLRGNPLCLNWCEDEPFNARAGDVFEFSNLKTHSVVNAGKTDRITAIVCFRTES